MDSLASRSPASFFSLLTDTENDILRRLPRSLMILMENAVTQGAPPAEVLAWSVSWLGQKEADITIPFRPSRILMQDTAGVAALVDIAALRDWAAAQGINPSTIDISVPIDLVIDHAVTVDESAHPGACRQNLENEFARNRERYEFFKWADSAFERLRITPPGNGICHQVNLERLASVCESAPGREQLIRSQTLIGTDSHTTMVNALGILGWGVGGVEAEVAALGEPLMISLPPVVKVTLTGQPVPGITATDLALSITHGLRKENVVGSFIEFSGEGAARLPLADRAAISNMCPEYGATCGLFPVDSRTVDYLRLTGRSEADINRTVEYAKSCWLWEQSSDHYRSYSREIVIELDRVAPAMAGPRRPHDLLSLKDVPASFRQHCEEKTSSVPVASYTGKIAIAAITSCTNTANPSLMIAAGLLARKARQAGLTPKPWVKTSLAPGSRRIAQLLETAGLQDDLDALGFHIVGFGCTTCVGNSGELKEELAKLPNDTLLCAVLSGNRNFENRIHPRIGAAYLASPPLVIASALTGRIDHDLSSAPLGETPDGQPVYLADIWPSGEEIAGALAAAQSVYAHDDEDSVSAGHWAALESPHTDRFPWRDSSTFVRQPPFFEGFEGEAEQPASITDAHILIILGDDVTTDHISPVGRIAPETPAGRYLASLGVSKDKLGSYGERRANSHVMRRGGFAHPSLRNVLSATPGPFTSLPDGTQTDIYEAARHYAHSGKSMIVIAGERYGTGSARDWAAKATALLGIKAVIAASFERIHRSNLIALGVLPVICDLKELTAHLTADCTVSLIDLDHISMESRSIGLSIMSGDGTILHTGTASADLRSEHELTTYQRGGIFTMVCQRLQDIDLNKTRQISEET